MFSPNIANLLSHRGVRALRPCVLALVSVLQTVAYPLGNFTFNHLSQRANRNWAAVYLWRKVE